MTPKYSLIMALTNTACCTGRVLPANALVCINATAVLSLVFTAAANGQTTEAPAAKLVWSGIIKHTTESAPEAKLGIKESMTYVPAKSIPAVLGARFGSIFGLSGLPKNQETVIRTVISHPTISAPDGKQTRGYNTESKVRPEADGTTTHMWGYSFDLPYEVVAGNWKIELWHSDRKLMEHTMVVTSAGAVLDPCETKNVPEGYPRDFPFLKGGFRLENPAIGSAYVYSNSAPHLVPQFSACAEKAGWNVKVEAHSEPIGPKVRHRFLATRGERRVSGSIFAYGNISSLMVILE